MQYHSALDPSSAIVTVGAIADVRFQLSSPFFFSRNGLRLRRTTPACVTPVRTSPPDSGVDLDSQPRLSIA